MSLAWALMDGIGPGLVEQFVAEERCGGGVGGGGGMIKQLQRTLGRSYFDVACVHCKIWNRVYRFPMKGGGGGGEGGRREGGRGAMP